MKDRPNKTAAEMYSDLAATLRRQNAHVDEQANRILKLEHALRLADKCLRGMTDPVREGEILAVIAEAMTGRG